MNITFENIIIKPGYIKANYHDDENSHFIEFELSSPIIVRNDLIGIALATLCGNNYHNIKMEIALTKKVQDSIKFFTKAELYCETDMKTYLINKSYGNHTLNFSGGFDSLAALAFLPSNSSLVSMDFGGHFSREMEMIQMFDTNTVKTNILETNFRKNSWLFMFIGSILYKDYLNTDFNISGGVIGAGFLKNTNFLNNYNTAIPIKESGMTSIPYTLGLSEVAAIKVALNNYPNSLDLSLKSLANPREEKRFRKQTLLQIELENSNSPLFLHNTVEKPAKPFSKWGENLLHDHLSLYIIKNVGFEYASLITSEIPESTIDFVSNLDMNFFERYNTDIVKYIPSQYRNTFFNTVNRAEILPYERRDWIEYHDTLKFLNKYHKINNPKVFR